jgi:hypothetical protein
MVQSQLSDDYMIITRSGLQGLLVNRGSNDFYSSSSLKQGKGEQYSPMARLTRAA